MARPVDETGNKYGHLTFLNPVGPGRKGRGALWIVRCDCGKVRDIHRLDVTKGRVKTCGKLRCPFLRQLRTVQPYRDRKAKERTIYRKFVHNLAKRNSLCRLTPEMFFSLILQPCKLCGDVPAPYGTVERQDVSREYTEENTIPVCRWCRHHMRNRNLRDYLEHLQKTILFLSTTQTT